MSSPLVSIAMTAYNSEKWIQDAIQSVLCSSMPDFELLLYDDGSTDKTRQIMADWAQRDSRVRLLGFRRLGRALALKTTIGASAGRFVCWVDADDLLAPKALETCLEAIRRESAELCLTGMTKITPTGHTIQHIMPSPPKKGLPFVNTHFCLMEFSLYSYAGGIDTDYECAMDLDLLLRCGMAASKTAVVREPLYFYRQHCNTISRRQRFEQKRCAQKAIAKAELKLRGTKNNAR